MNGILFLSSDSGMLLFCEYYNETFGIKNRLIGEDPAQLSAFVYTIYKNSVNAIDDKKDVDSGLQYFIAVSLFLN